MWQVVASVTMVLVLGACDRSEPSPSTARDAPRRPSTSRAEQRAADEAEARAAERPKLKPPDSVCPDDFAVLNAALSHMAADPEFSTLPTLTGDQIVLQHLTGGGSAFVRPSQVKADAGTYGVKIVPDDAVADLEARNNSSEFLTFSGEPDAQKWTKTDRAPAPLTGFKPDSSKVVVADLGTLQKGKSFQHPTDLWDAFANAYPDAKGYVIAFLPGYSSDRRRALARFALEPTPHGATGTYLLERAADGKWTVVWRFFARYA